MSIVHIRGAFAAAAICATGLAQADLVGVLQATPIAAPATVAFHNSAVTAGTTSTIYNFLDQWSFSLAPAADISAIAASINFFAADGSSVLFGVTNLQINVVTVPAGGTPLVSWATVSTPVTGLQQTVALVPKSPLTDGNYLLQVRGTVTEPGSYSGSFIAMTPAAVPLPASLPLFGAGIAGFALLSRRRSRR